MATVTYFKGIPVFVMRAGHYPNKADILQIMGDHPDAVVRTEPMRSDDTGNHTRFVITVRENHHVR